MSAPASSRSRRRFLRTATWGGLAGLGLAAAKSWAESQNQAEAKTEEGEIIDIHQHVNFHARGNEALVKHQETMGVALSVLLPAGSVTQGASTHLGKSNGLAARIFGTEASARLAAEHPDRFVYFANEVPDLDSAQAELEKWLKKDARGIGEQKFALDCDAAPLRKIYEVARAFSVPVLLHFEEGAYNMAFERFHKVLEAFPGVNFIGHGPSWWGYISADHDPKVMYPKGPVKPGGLMDKYLADYPNMWGDLSAGSGLNAMTRDEEHAAAFLTRHAGKLCLGTDCADSVGQGEGCSGSRQIATVKRLVADPALRRQIFSTNARKLIRF